jgi:hypothetical protein
VIAFVDESILLAGHGCYVLGCVVAGQPQWVEDSAPRLDSLAEDHVHEMCVLARRQLSSVPLEGRVIWHALLVAQYVRYREGSVAWAPGIAFTSTAA